MRLSQIDLVKAICREVERQGIEEVELRHLNAIVAACDDIVREFGRESVRAAAGMGLAAWAASDDTGQSSKAMARHLAPLAGIGAARPWVDDPTAHPRDPADLGRCIRLLAAVPELRPHLPAMAEVSPAWAALVVAWDEIEALYATESPSGSAPECYRRMKELTEEPA